MFTIGFLPFLQTPWKESAAQNAMTFEIFLHLVNLSIPFVPNRDLYRKAYLYSWTAIKSMNYTFLFAFYGYDFDPMCYCVQMMIHFIECKSCGIYNYSDTSFQSLRYSRKSNWILRKNDGKKKKI